MIVLDVETSGLDPEKHSLVSIAAIDFDDPEERFFETCRIWEGADIDPNALKVNGLSPEELVDEDKKTEADVVQNFIEWALSKRDITIAGHNPFVDVAFVNAALKRAGSKERLPKRTFDQHTLVLNHMLKRGLTPPILDKRSDINSDKVMEYVGLPLEPKPHVGINGALWEFEAIHRLVYETRKLEEFLAYPIPWVKID